MRSCLDKPGELPENLLLRKPPAHGEGHGFLREGQADGVDLLLPGNDGKTDRLRIFRFQERLFQLGKCPCRPEGQVFFLFPGLGKCGEEAPEAELPVNLADRRALRIPRGKVADADRKGRVGADRRELLRELGEIVMLLHGLPRLLRRDLVLVRLRVLYAVVFGDDGGSGFRPDARKAGNVVRGIAHERLHVDKLLRRNAHFPHHVVRKIPLVERLAALGLGQDDLRLVAGDLEKIPVAGQDARRKALRLAPAREGSEDIVGLKARKRHDGDPHGVQNLFDQRKLLMEFRRRGLSRALVVLEPLVAEGLFAGVEGDGHIRRPFLLQHLPENGKKPVDGIGMGAVRSRHRKRHPVKCAEKQAVPVHQENFLFHNTSILSVRNAGT